MITRIKTDNGERWAIVFDNSCFLEEIGEMADGLTDVMIAASTSELFDNSADGFRNALYLLRTILPTNEQLSEYENYLIKTKKIKGIHSNEE